MNFETGFQNFEKLAFQFRKIMEKENTRFRDLYFRNAHDDFNKLCVAMDTWEDTLLAVSDYFKNESERNDGERYLRFYGALQAVYLQQESIKAIYQITMGQKFPKKMSDSPWIKIRDLRNNTTGHPVRTDSGKRVFLVRPSVGGDKVHLLTFDTKTGKDNHIEVDLKGSLSDYFSEAVQIGNQLVEAADKKWPKV